MPQAKATIKGHPIHPAMVAVPIGHLAGANKCADESNSKSKQRKRHLYSLTLLQ